MAREQHAMQRKIYEHNIIIKIRINKTKKDKKRQRKSSAQMA